MAIYLEFIIFVINLAILFVIFDNIKRTKGKFNKSLKVVFLAFSIFFIANVLVLLSELNIFKSETLAEALEIIFLVVIFIGVFTVNGHIRKVHDNNKKKKYRKMK